MLFSRWQAIGLEALESMLGESFAYMTHATFTQAAGEGRPGQVTLEFKQI